MSAKLDKSLAEITKENRGSGRGGSRGGRGGRGGSSSSSTRSSSNGSGSRGSSQRNTTGGGRGGGPVRNERRPGNRASPYPSSRSNNNGGGFFTTSYAPVAQSIDGAWAHDKFESTQRISASVVSGPTERGVKAEGIVLVSNLDEELSAKELKNDVFGDFSVKDVAVNYDQNGRSLGTATVTFNSVRDAQKAFDEFDGATIDGKEMSVRMIGSLGPPPPKQIVKKIVAPQVQIVPQYVYQQQPTFQPRQQSPAPRRNDSRGAPQRSTSSSRDNNRNSSAGRGNNNNNRSQQSSSRGGNTTRGGRGGSRGGSRGGNAGGRREKKEETATEASLDAEMDAFLAKRAPKADAKSD